MEYLYYGKSMNRLTRTDRIQILRLLVEGNSLRATARIVGVSLNTVMKLLVDAGRAAAIDHNCRVRNVLVKRIQCDEIWSFVGAKQKNVDNGAEGIGDVWTWTGMDAETKLMLSYRVGDRSGETALSFIRDIAVRVVPHPELQVTTDGHQAYIDAMAYGLPEASYAQLIKQYGASSQGDGPERRYSAAECIGTKVRIVAGDPVEEFISTSHVERQNLTMRMCMRRFTRLTNGFSKKMKNHYCAIALHFFSYNFCRVHRTLKTTPAVKAGLIDRVQDLGELVDIIAEESARDVATRRKDRKSK